VAEDWSREEVEATVADYFDMLEKELRGDDYNKSEHRRGLASLLNGRSDGAVERKHQNISAILIELGFVYISGYKPLRNYQQRLFEVVSDRLAANRSLTEIVRQQVSEPAPVPTVEDILTAWAEPPTPNPDRGRYGEPSPPRRGVDFLAMEAANRSLGSAGEVFVVRFEVARLLRAGKHNLADSVERVSETKGDGLGYDVHSFEDSGRDRLIEVKTTAYGPSTPFYVTRNEVAVSRAEGERFHLYRAYNFRRAPRLFSRPGPLEQSFRLDPSEYVATVN
jgi:hypothetical protein